MDYPLFDFIVASLLMGLGIGVDVAVATAARAKQLCTMRLAIIWIVGVSFTHTVFPMAGYLLTYFSIQVQPAIEPVIGILAFTCIFYYLRSELIELAHPKKQGDERQLMVTLGLILAVSWDALWSGPAKSAQVIGWPEFYVWGSFLLVGALVSILAILSLSFAVRVQQSFIQTRLANGFSLWVQYSVIGYFGLLAVLRYTLNMNVQGWQVLILSATLIGVALMFAIHRGADELGSDFKAS
ncbi:MAG: hypothetical protein ABJJ44_15125 [Paraglaciecola sp.]|uniref:hypothetical protein n=1 Tax=Paraglaciecola sp. TaxID=1920173 RepID=UPI00329721A1